MKVVYFPDTIYIYAHILNKLVPSQLISYDVTYTVILTVVDIVKFLFYTNFYYF